MKTVDDIYQQIAQNTASTIGHTNWIKASLYIQGDSSYVDTNGTYIGPDNQEYPLDVQKFDDDLDFSIMELHEITTEGGNNKWNRAVFSLTPDGEFDMEFIWDQRLQDEIERLAKK